MGKRNRNKKAPHRQARTTFRSKTKASTSRYKVAMVKTELKDKEGGRGGTRSTVSRINVRRVKPWDIQKTQK